jgi:hypothetical protein
MKFQFFIILLVSLFVLSCTNEVKLTFENPLAVDRADEVIVLTQAELAAKMDVAEGKLPLLKTADGLAVPSQLDDLDGDGNWDELVFLLGFKAGEKKVLSVEQIAANDYPEFEKRTNLRLGIHQEDGSYKEVDNYKAIPYNEPFEIISQGEGVTWENDKIGFRVYFDCRNVKDLFAKRKPELIADKVHTPGFGSYHDLADWGMDVLHCGSSLGAGGIALLKNDSLFRVGSTDVFEYQKLVEGPVRSIFELRYSGWNVDGENMEAVEHITIYPGKYWFESDVTVNGCSDDDQIVTGIVTSMLKEEPFEFEAANFKCIGTHGMQSLNNDELGMAVLVPAAESGKIARTTDINFFELGYQTVKAKKFSNIISETYYIGQKCSSGTPAKHYFFSVWGLDKDQWKTEEGFKKYIGEEAEKLSAPIVKL